MFKSGFQTKRDGDNIIGNFDLQLILLWRRTNKLKSPVYHNLTTGIQSENLEEVIDQTTEYAVIDQALGKNGVALVEYCSIINVDGEEFLFTTMGHLRTARCMPGETRSIIGREAVLFNKKKEIYAPKTLIRELETSTVFEPRKTYRMNSLKEYGNRVFLNGTSILDVIKDFIGVGIMEGNRTTQFQFRYEIYNWLLYKEPEKKVTPRQKLIDTLISYPLTEYEITSDEKLATVDAITYENQSYAVLRTYASKQECARLYISHKQIIGCKKSHTGGYTPFNQWKKSPVHWNFSFFELNLNNFKGTLLEYYCSIADKMPSEALSIVLWLLLSFPILEQMAKHSEDGLTALKNLALILKTEQHNPFGKILSFWGVVDLNKKKLHQKFGVSSSLFDEGLKNFALYLEAYREKNSLATPCLISPSLLKFMIGQNDLSSIDENTINAVKKVLIDTLETAKGMHKTNCMHMNMFALIRSTWGIQAALNSDAFINELVRADIQEERQWIQDINFNRRYIEHIFRDYCHMVEQTGMQSRCRPKFKNMDDLFVAHDMLTELVNHRRLVINQQKWQARQPFWKKWIYNGDEEDNYMIIAPESPEDLAHEGLTLCHCVKSYIAKVSAGLTNILFARRKTAPEEPFFTIEISNDGSVEQIHGFSNRNLETEPELIPFVKKWIKAKKINAHNYNKVR